MNAVVSDQNVRFKKLIKESLENVLTEEELKFGKTNHSIKNVVNAKTLRQFNFFPVRIVNI